MRIAALLVAVAFVSACHSAQHPRLATTAASNPAVQADRDGLTTMRMVLSAQASRAKGMPFNSLSDVLKGLPTLQSGSSAIDAETAALNGGYRLRRRPQLLDFEGRSLLGMGRLDLYPWPHASSWHWSRAVGR